MMVVHVNITNQPEWLKFIITIVVEDYSYHNYHAEVLKKQCLGCNAYLLKGCIRHIIELALDSQTHRECGCRVQFDLTAKSRNV